MLLVLHLTINFLLYLQLNLLACILQFFELKNQGKCQVIGVSSSCVWGFIVDHFLGILVVGSCWILPFPYSNSKIGNCLPFILFPFYWLASA